MARAACAPRPSTPTASRSRRSSRIRRSAATGSAGTAVEPLEVEPLTDLVGLHERAEIELRVLPNLWPLWNDVAASTLEFSGMRLRNAAPMLAP